MKKIVVLIGVLAWLATTPISGSSQNSEKHLDFGSAEVQPPVYHDLSSALRDIQPIKPEPEKPAREKRQPFKIPKNTRPPQHDPVAQTSVGIAVATTPGLGFDGLGVPNSTVVAAPPDPNGAPGARVTLPNGTVINQYVQWANEAFAVFDKGTGGIIYGPANGNTLWKGFGGPCEANNDGDGIIQYDKAANRWLITQLSVTGGPPYYQCVAVSTTADATGSYNRYAFQYSDFNDYPKVGVWPDGYYVSFNMFQGNNFLGSKVCAYDRAAILGTVIRPVTQQCFQLSSAYGGLLPADLDGATPPPAGSPNFFLATDTNVLRFWKFHVDWTTPTSTTLSGPVTIPVAAFTEACNGGVCIPQAGTTQQLDSLGDRLMYRLAYRYFADGHEALVVNHSVNAGNNITGLRWYEVRNPTGGTLASGMPVLYQQGTYAPDSTHRWMGSMAMDNVGNIAIGYSVSSSTLHPGIRYTGRAPTDPLGLLGVETSILEGTGSQNGSPKSLNRWGDYSSLNVDPTDDCTLWYTTEYLKADGTFNWSTRIASFKFTTCGTSPEQPFGGTPWSIPGRIQAEDYDTGGEGVAYHDNEAANLGGQYRPSEGVDIEATTDTGGGFDVGYMLAGEWLKYTVNVQTAGTYTLAVRVAAAGAGGTFHIEVNGIDKTGPLTIPNTGGWQTWQTVTKTGVSLSAGVQVLRLVLDTNGPINWVGNINYIEVTTGTSSSAYGGTAWAIPGHIEAENYDLGGEGVAYHDNEAANLGGQYRPSEGVDIEATTDTGGGFDVGYMLAGEWLKYTVNVQTAGTYTLAVRVAAAGAGGTFHIEVNGIDKTGPLTIPNTGGWQTWQTVTKTGISLSAGVQVLRLVLDTNGPINWVGNVNYIDMTFVSGGTLAVTGFPAAVTAGTLGTVTVTAKDATGNVLTGYTGTVHFTSSDAQATLPANYTFVAGDNGTHAFTNGVTLKTAGTQSITATDTVTSTTGNQSGITVNTGTFITVQLLVPGETAAPGSATGKTGAPTPQTAGTAFNVTVNAVDANWNLVNTVTHTIGITSTTDAAAILPANAALAGGTKTFNVTLKTAGAQTITATDLADTSKTNTSPSITVTAGPSSSPYGGTAWAIPGRIEAENYDVGGEGVAYHDLDANNNGGQYRLSEGVDIEATTDTGGGFDVGWTLAGEWLKYTVNVTSSGTYTLAARVAAAGNGGTFHIEVNGIDKTGPLAMPNTGGWQQWQTLTKTGVSLNAGVQVLRIVMDSNGPIGGVGNVNYIDFSP